LLQRVIAVRRTHQKLLFCNILRTMIHPAQARRSESRRELGLSLGTQQLHAIVFVTRLFFKIYEWDLL
jgi:hypothetical protein